jgi:hypothetical protein
VCAQPWTDPFPGVQKLGFDTGQKNGHFFTTTFTTTFICLSNPGQTPFRGSRNWFLTPVKNCHFSTTTFTTTFTFFQILDRPRSGVPKITCLTPFPKRSSVLRPLLQVSLFCQILDRPRSGGPEGGFVETGPKTIISVLRPLLQLSFFGQILDRPLSGGSEIGFLTPVRKRSFLYYDLNYNFHFFVKSWTDTLSSDQKLRFRHRSQNDHSFLRPLLQLSMFCQILDRHPFERPEIGSLTPVPKRSFLYCDLYYNFHALSNPGQTPLRCSRNWVFETCQKTVISLLQP